MSATPRFKVYNAQGDYRAAFKDASEAAVLVAVLGEGATIRKGHRTKDIVYTEGAFENGAVSAADSYDDVAEMVEYRMTGKPPALSRETKAVAK